MESIEGRKVGKNIGIDGCRRGWIGVFRDGGTGVPEAAIFDAIEDVCLPSFTCVAVDIPIGLPEMGSRDCDREARRFLGKTRGSSIFPAPLRSLLEATSYSDACDIRQAVERKMISLQTWNIIPKIAETDRLLQGNEEVRGRIFEVHPELSFSRMNGGRPLPTKKKEAAGRRERELLVDACFGEETFRRLRASLLPRKGWGDDDLLDACAALWTAERIAAGAAFSLPAVCPVDATGLPMRIVY